jgi:homotetrameric cytidine deaminase
MAKAVKAELVAAAARARAQAVAPYSRFHVGAALLTRDGQVITGANVESASYGLTCCAERVALFKALTEGHRDFTAVAVVAPAPGGPLPCGACRQLLAEYAPHARVWVADSAAPERIREFRMERLLPLPFVLVPSPGDAGKGKARRTASARARG